MVLESRGGSRAVREGQGRPGGFGRPKKGAAVVNTGLDDAERWETTFCGNTSVLQLPSGK